MSYNHINCHHKLGWIFIIIATILITTSIILLIIDHNNLIAIGLLFFGVFMIMCPLQLTCDNWDGGLG